MAGGLGLGDLAGPFQPKPVYDSMKRLNISVISAFSMKTISLLELRGGQGGAVQLMRIGEVKAQACVWGSLRSVGDILF